MGVNRENACALSLVCIFIILALKNYMKFAADNKKRKTGQSHSEKLMDDRLSGQKLVHCYNNYFEACLGRA